jgi:hypothetical protein
MGPDRRPAWWRGVEYFGERICQPFDRRGASAIPFSALLGCGGLFPVVASQTSFMHPRWDVGAFDFEDRTRATLPADSRAVHFLKADFRLVDLIVSDDAMPMAYTRNILAYKSESLLIDAARPIPRSPSRSQHRGHRWDLLRVDASTRYGTGRGSRGVGEEG